METTAVAFVCKKCGCASTRVGQLKPTVCDTCKAANKLEAERKRWKTNLQPVVEIAPGFRRCLTCEQDKLQSEYTFNKGVLRRHCHVCYLANRAEKRATQDRSAEYSALGEQRRLARLATRPFRLRAIEHASRTRKAYAKIDANFAAKRKVRDAAKLLVTKPWLSDGATAAERAAAKSAWERVNDRPAYAWNLLRTRVKKPLYAAGIAWADLGCRLDDVIPMDKRSYCIALIDIAETAFPGKDVFSLETGFRQTVDHFGGCTIDGLRGVLALDNVRVDSNHVDDKPWLAGEMSSGQRDRLRATMDPAFAIELKLRQRMRSRSRGRAGEVNRGVRNGVKGRALNKATFRFVGYTPAELRVHLESQFTPEMSWEAFLDARIHLDHIRPLSSYDLTDDAQLKAAWAMSNLQPLWAIDNMKKGAKWDAPANDNEPIAIEATTRKSYWQGMTEGQRLQLAA